MKINLELTEQEAKALADLMDAGVRHQGLFSAGIAAHLAGKLQTAAQAAEAADQENDNG